MRNRLFPWLTVGIVFICFSAQAGTIVENGAGSLPATAQDLTGLFPTEILGTLDGTNSNDVNVFEIDILNPVDFSAITVDAGPHSVHDTELFLFDSAGFGVYFNDDIDFINTLSCLPSSDAGNPCPNPAGGLGPLTAGTYFLAITRSFNSPLDALGNSIFTNSSSADVVGPNAGAGAIASWDDSGNADPDFDSIHYDIQLAGTTPEPATWTMLAGAGLAGLFIARKRRLGQES